MYETSSSSQDVRLTDGTLHIQLNDLKIVICDDPTYTHNSADNLRTYDGVHQLTSDASGSKRAVVIEAADGSVSSCILLANGCPMGIIAHSAIVVDDILYVAIDDHIAALSIPSLELNWATCVDFCCFGIHYFPLAKCFVIHGELTISRLSRAGKIEWQQGGVDIFSGSFAVRGDVIHAEDFNGRCYRFSLESGALLE